MDSSWGRFVKSNGFTLVEAMITVAVLAILLGVAVPSFRTMVMNNRLQATRTDITGAFTLAKSEALKRGTPVYVTALGTASGNEFAGGWRVWADSNGNATLDAGEPTIRQHEAYAPSIVIATLDSGTGGTFTSVGFTGRGYLIGAAKSLTICDGRPGATGGRIVLTPAGTVDLQENFTC